jgi:hypothetical protein
MAKSNRPRDMANDIIGALRDATKKWTSTRKAEEGGVQAKLAANAVERRVRRTTRKTGRTTEHRRGACAGCGCWR